MPDVLLNHLLKGALSPDAFADLVDHLAGQCFIAEHAQIHIEQCLLFRAQLGREPVRYPFDVFPYCLHGGLEQRQFLLDLLGGLLGHQIQVCRRIHNYASANGHTRSAGHAVEADVLGFFTGKRQATDRARGFTVGDHPGQLG